MNPLVCPDTEKPVEPPHARDAGWLAALKSACFGRSEEAAGIEVENVIVTLGASLLRAVTRGEKYLALMSVTEAEFCTDAKPAFCAAPLPVGAEVFSSESLRQLHAHLKQEGLQPLLVQDGKDSSPQYNLVVKVPDAFKANLRKGESFLQLMSGRLDACLSRINEEALAAAGACSDSNTASFTSEQRENSAYTKFDKLLLDCRSVVKSSYAFRESMKVLAACAYLAGSDEDSLDSFHAVSRLSKGAGIAGPGQPPSDGQIDETLMRLQGVIDVFAGDMLRGAEKKTDAGCLYSGSQNKTR